MIPQACSCDKFNHFEGASVAAYTKAFLEDAASEDAPNDDAPPLEKGVKRLRCRVCGRMWERRAAEAKGASETASARASLIKISE